MLRRHATEELAAARLQLGVSPELIADLEGFVAAEPIRERRWVLLTEALVRSGREREAMAVVGRAREVMRSEPGVTSDRSSSRSNDSSSRIIDNRPR